MEATTTGLDQLDALNQEIAALEQTFGSAQAAAAAFDSELAGARDSMIFTSREVNTLSAGLSRGLRSAFDGVVFDGMKLSDALQRLAQTMIDTVYSIAMKPVMGAVGGALASGLNGLLSGIFPFANGAGFAQGRVMPFAHGGVVTAPTMFPMRGARGVMGEAGPEAIMPLARGADGRLGVQMSGGGGRAVTVNVNVTTPDVQGFQRSQSQIAAQMARALARGERNR